MAISLVDFLVLLFIIFVPFGSLENYDGFSLISIDKTSLSNNSHDKISRLEDGASPNFILILDLEEESFALQNDSGLFIKELLDGEEVQYKILESNYKKVIDLERSSIEQLKAEKSHKQKGIRWATNYRTFEETKNWYKDLSKSYPEYVEYIENISNQTTAENRTIFAIRIYNRYSTLKKEDRKIIWIESLLHAREWLSGATVNYITAMLLDQLTNSIESDANSDIANLVNLIDYGNIEFLVIPICNPDGYEYTWKTDRIWRKNRSYLGKGVDLNRNFDSKWGYSGASTNPRSEVYNGPKVASENETIALQSFFDENSHRIIMALDIHSFSQFILWPWSYDYVAVHPQEAVNKKSAIILAMLGMEYTVMKSSSMYACSGTASDYYAQNDIISLTIELPPRHMGEGGFIIPPAKIESVGNDWMLKISSWVTYAFEEVKHSHIYTYYYTHHKLLARTELAS